MMHNCPVKRCRDNQDGFCLEQSCTNYVLYRQVTKRCETCNSLMRGHPSCESCNILTGSGHWESLSSYRGHRICERCISAWKALDKVARMETKWQHFLTPQSLFIFPTDEAFYLRASTGEIPAQTVE